MISLRPEKSGGRPAMLFFVELIIALLFFVISGAVILKVFAAADGKSRDSKLSEDAALCAQSVAEAFSVSGSAEKAFVMIFGESFVPQDAGHYIITLNDALMPDENGTIVLSAVVSGEKYPAGLLSRLSMEFIRDGDKIYTLKCSAYAAEGGGSDG